MLPHWGRLAVAAAIFLTSLPAIAQIIPGSELPGRERDRFVQPKGPLSQPGGAVISLPSTTAPPGAEKVVVVVRGVRITGATVYSAADFAPLYQELVGRAVPLTAIYDLAAKITAKYGNDGYVLSRAIVPPQELSPEGSVIHLQVIEGYIDQVVWPPALSKYRDFFSYYTAKILADRPINVRTLERYLLLAGDLPGLKFTNSLKPSATAQGAATLVVEVQEKPIDYLGRVDNRGSKARGPYQFLSSLTVNNLGRFHESLTLTYAATFQMKELQYWALGYRQVLTPEGLTLFVNGSNSRSKPGSEVLTLLDYRTRSEFLEGGFAYPFIRQRESNLIATALFFMSNDRSDIFEDFNTLDKLRGIRGKVDADWADPWRGINQINVTVSQGFNGAGASSNDSLNKSRANGRVDFTKVEATVSRLQPIGMGFSVLASAYGQWTNTPLLSPELCGYGGRGYGRAYDPSELVADQCLLLLGELRYDVPVSLPGLQQFQFYGFADRGWLHNIAPVAGTPENVDGASVGGGLRLGSQPGLAADLSAAKGVEGVRKDWRFFFIVTGRY